MDRITIHFANAGQEYIFGGLKAAVARALVEHPTRNWTTLEMVAHLREHGFIYATPSVVSPRLNELRVLGIACQGEQKRPCAINRKRKHVWRLADGAAPKITVEVTR